MKAFKREEGFSVAQEPRCTVSKKYVKAMKIFELFFIKADQINIGFVTAVLSPIVATSRLS